MLFRLVLDVERYPEFVPGCARVRVLSRQQATSGCTEIVSRMTVGVLPLQVGYTNRTRADPDAKRIIVMSSDRPLRHLHVVWRFQPLAAGHTLVLLDACYDFRSPILAVLAERMFERLFGRLLDAFERRASSLDHAAR